jgi:ethanolamine permease
LFLLQQCCHISNFIIFNISTTSAAGANAFLPNGYIGIWAAVPFAIWFFLAVEGVPLAAEEAKEPQKSLPRGLIGAMLILTTFALLILILGVGAGEDTLKILEPLS